MFKALFSVAVLSALVTSAAYASTPEEIQQQAEQAYAQRDFTPAGLARVQNSADLYSQLVAMTTDRTQKVEFMNHQAEALYFLGWASSAKEQKKTFHWAGYELAGSAVESFGVTKVESYDPAIVNQLKTQLTAHELAVLGEALYYRGIHLGQWGQAEGVVKSLSKWPELRDNMQLIIDLGMRDIHDGGPLRTLGRGYHKIPGMFGGSKEKAEKYFRTAIDSTRVAGKDFSRNGTNNTFMAELLIDMGREAEAKTLLQNFIAADLSLFEPSTLVEVKRAMQDSRDILSEM